MKPRVLFLCTGNSCRSQMAEGFANALLKSSFEFYSAGTNPQVLNRYAVLVMREVGIDISHHYPKSLESLGHLTFSLVVTVCDDASGACPTPPHGTRMVHKPFDDPPRLALNASTETEALSHYRRVRDEIEQFVLTLPSLIEFPGKR